VDNAALIATRDQIRDLVYAARQRVTTTFGNIGYLSPERRWIDTRVAYGSPVDECIAELVAYCESVVVPFALAHADLRSVAETIRDEVFPGPKREADERLAVIYALLGDSRLATGVIQRLSAWGPGDNMMLSVHDVLYRDGFTATFPSTG
jgi:hypothetical protein